MQTHHLIGLVVIFVGVLDILLGLFLIGPRVPESQRRIVVTAFLSGGVALAALGFAFVAGLIL